MEKMEWHTLLMGKQEGTVENKLAVSSVKHQTPKLTWTHLINTCFSITWDLRGMMS